MDPQGTHPDLAARVRIGVQDGVLSLVLDAPDRLNAVDPPMLDSLAAAVAAAAFPEVRAITLTGSGRGFCAGANLATGTDGELVDDRTLYAGGRLVRALVASPVPTIALVNGVAAGLGVSIALACDYVLCAESASFTLAFSKIALMPDGGATALVAANIGRARAMRLALTGERVPATTAATWGLVSETVPDDAFGARGAELAATFAALGPGGVRHTKEAINAAALDLAGALDREEAGQSVLLRSADFREGAAAFMEKRSPTFRGE